MRQPADGRVCRWSGSCPLGSIAVADRWRSRCCRAAKVSGSRRSRPSRLVVRLRFDLVEGGAAALNFGDDVLGGGFPDEWLGIVVPVFCPGGDCGGEVGGA